MFETTQSARNAPYDATASSHLPMGVPVDGKTLAEAYLRRVEIEGKEPVFLVKREGRYTKVLWEQLHELVLGVFSSHQSFGIGKGDKVCILSQSRPEWIVADIATMCSGAVTVPIYHSNSVEDITFIIDNCEAKLIYVEDQVQYEKAVKALASLNKKIPMVSFSELTAEDVLSFRNVSEFKNDREVEKAFEKSVTSIAPDSVASIVYTSGTTGKPKGAVLLHSNFTAEIRTMIEDLKITQKQVTLTFLPFAHIMGRIESLIPIFSGITLGFAESINSVSQNIGEVCPTLLVSVPRIYEKIYTKIQSEVEAQSSMRKNIFQWAVNVGREVARCKSEKTPIPLTLVMKYRIADQLVFSKIRRKLGGAIRFTVSGGAPLSSELCEFFHACGIRVLEAYGLTETTAAICINQLEDYCFGTVGKPMTGIELRIAEDGEILLRGPMIFKEYYRNPEATAEVFREGGWFATGDIGEITERGFLKITDRKKELIVTSGGKKIAPQKLENLLKQSRFISHGIVYGDKQKFITALVTLNEPEVLGWAKTQGLHTNGGKFEELTKLDAIYGLIESEIKKVNAQLPSFETIKRFKILPRDFSIETGELTPSLKLKRRVCSEKYRAYIEEMYA